MVAHRCSRCLRWCAAPVLLLAAVLPAPAADNPSWIEIRSPHFTVVTDAGEQRGRDAAQRFEQIRAAFGVLFHRMQVNLPLPLQIIAFRDAKEMRTVSPVWERKTLTVAGLFQPASDRNFIVIDLSAGQGWEVVFHEYVHLLLNGNFPPMPAWFDEGFAEYFTTLKVSDREIDFGLVPDAEANALAGQWMDTSQILAITHDSPEYNESDRRNIFYAQSWLMVHYFMAKKMMDSVSQYLALTQQEKVPPREAFQRAFNMTPEQFDKTLREYWRQSPTSFRVSVPAGFDTRSYEVSSLNELDARATLADLKYHLKDYQDQGLKEFEAILKQQPDNLPANRALGYSYLMQGRFDDAAHCFRRIAAQDSKDPQALYYTALLSNRQALMAGKMPDNLPQMRQQLEAAIALDPGYADAYNLMAYTLWDLGDMKAATAAMEKAVELKPRDDRYAANLVQYYLRQQDMAKAEPLLVRLQDSKIAEIASMARSNLAQLQSYQKAMAPPARAAVPEMSDPTAPQWRPKPGQTPPSVEIESSEEKPAGPPVPEKTRYMKGTLVSVDCSHPPEAVLAIREGGRMWQISVPDISQAVVIGADTLSCSWGDKPVSVNYQPTGAGRGRLVSIELP